LVGNRVPFGLHEYVDVVLVNLKAELFPDIVNEHTDDVPVAQVLDVLLQNIALEAFEGKPYLLVEHGVLEVVERGVGLVQPPLAQFLQHLLGFQDHAPRADHRNCEVLAREGGQVVVDL
jgi:hypothetical protein